MPKTGGIWAVPDHTHEATPETGGVIPSAVLQPVVEPIVVPLVEGHNHDTVYVRDDDASWTDLTDSGVTTLHSHAGGSLLYEAGGQLRYMQGSTEMVIVDVL